MSSHRLPEGVHSGVEVIDVDVTRVTMKQEFERHTSPSSVGLQVVATNEIMGLHDAGNERGKSRLSARVTKRGVEFIRVHLE